jgi:TRAP-type C4-dicarboxylate transport system permease small subunit
MTTRISRIIPLLRNLGLWIAGASLIFMIVLVTFEVVSRRFLGFSLYFSYEYSGYLLIAITFMGAAFTLHAGGFTRMEVLYDRFKGKAHFILDFLIYIVAFAYLLVIAYWLWIYVADSYSSGITSISIAQTPLYIPRVFMFLGVALLVLEVGSILIRLVLLSGDKKNRNR